MSIENRARLAAIKYLKLSGRDIIDDDYLGKFIVIEDDYGIAFVDVIYTCGNMSLKPSRMKREEFEEVMYKFCEQNDYVGDVPVRYDIIMVHVIDGKDRAVIRHFIDADLEA